MYTRTPYKHCMYKGICMYINGMLDLRVMRGVNPVVTERSVHVLKHF